VIDYLASHPNTTPVDFKKVWDLLESATREVCVIFTCYESLIAKLRLILLTRVSINFYHPNTSTGNRVNTFLLTVRLNFVVSVN
jgi:hypothetical protein